MATENERPREVNLSSILEGLCDARVEFILVGGLAAVVQGAPVTTMDVDIVHHQSAENITKLLAFLKTIEAIHRRPDDKLIGASRKDLTGTGHVLYTTRLGPLDLLSVIEKGYAYSELLEHSVEIKFRGYKLLVLDLRTMIQLKKASSDPKDRRRLPVLEETLRQLEEKKV